jgi:hypothetical protein
MQDAGAIWINTIFDTVSVCGSINPFKGTLLSSQEALKYSNPINTKLSKTTVKSNEYRISQSNMVLWVAEIHIVLFQNATILTAACTRHGCSATYYYYY